MKARIQHIHFTGIGGIGMSGIAELLHNQGFAVQGSDASENANVERLRTLGMTVFIGHAAKHLGKAQVVVASSAIASDNVELEAARRRGIPVIPRAEMLAELMRMKHGIAVAGSHGKTTITSLIAHAMEAAGLDPTYVIGGRLVATGDNARLGESPYLVAEADESDGSFLHLSPMIAVVSNIDPEHLDHYGDFEHLLAAFRQFVELLPFYGRAVLHHEHPHVAALREHLHKPVTTYGTSPQADIHLLDITYNSLGQQLLKVGLRNKGELGEFQLALPGRHNAENALAAIAVLLDLGIEVDVIQQGMASFSGIQRRFQRTAAGEGILVDDYAHHPREIRATLDAARECWPDKALLAIFQPHRYTRSRDLMQDFYSAFDVAHEVALLPIYAAGEKPIAGISSERMADGLRSYGHRNASLCKDLEDARERTKAALAEGKIVLLMGAGSIGGLATDMRAELEGKAT